jgi:hypothetical protein
MEFYDKYGKIKKISVKFEPMEKKELKNNEVKQEPKPEAKAAVKPMAKVITEDAEKPEAARTDELELEKLVAGLVSEKVPEAEPAVEVTSKHWTIPVTVVEEEPAAFVEAEPAFEAVQEPEPEPLPEVEVEVTSKHWTVPVPVVEPQLEIRKEEDLMATNRFDKIPQKEINYCEDICKDEEQKKVCFYYRNKEYLTDNFMNKCEEAKAYEMNQKKEQEERAERERLLKELFGSEQE